MPEGKSKDTCQLVDCSYRARFRVLYRYRFGTRKQFSDTRYAYLCTEHHKAQFPSVLGTALKSESLSV